MGHDFAAETDSTDPLDHPAGLDDDRAALLLAMLPGIGPRTMACLVDCLGTPRAVLEADREQLSRVPGVGPQLVERISTAAEQVDLDALLQWCRDHQVTIIARDTEHYPFRLTDLSDAPPVLFVRGQVIAEDELAVAIVGTRHATSYGLRQAERFAGALSRAGVTIVSGLARGIDAAAHQGALAAGGRTLAVLGGGLAQIYPREHEGLADAVAADGALISEFAPQAKSRPGMFPQRNRLIAGIALATLVVEAPERSGALITARLAGEQNRDVFALPGPVTSRASRGTNQLIRDGATLVQSVDDILEQLGPISEPVLTRDGRELHHPAELQLNDLERQVLDAIEVTSTSIDEVIRGSGLAASRVLATISVLERRRLIRRLSGQYVSRI